MTRLTSTLSFLLAVGILIAGALGPLGLGIIRFHVTELVENQYLGGEIVTLAIAAPALVAAGILWRRLDPLAPVIAIGPAIYTVYTFITVILGQEYGRLPGNAGKAFFLYAGLVSGGTALAVLSGRQIAVRESPRLTSGLCRALAAAFLLIVAFFALAWVGQILLVYRGDPPAEYVDSPNLFWLIKMLDLAFLLPVFALTSAGLLRRHAAAVRFAYGLIGYAVCMSGAILGMAIAMQLKGDPSASPGMILFLTPVFAVLAWLAIRMLRLYRPGRLDDDRDAVTGAGHAAT